MFLQFHKVFFHFFFYFFCPACLGKDKAEWDFIQAASPIHPLVKGSSVTSASFGLWNKHQEWNKLIWSLQTFSRASTPPTWYHIILTNAACISSSPPSAWTHSPTGFHSFPPTKVVLKKIISNLILKAGKTKYSCAHFILFVPLQWCCTFDVQINYNTSSLVLISFLMDSMFTFYCDIPSRSIIYRYTIC